ncbi:carbon-nitrogen hydrolase family protein [Streptomyces sp. ISL-36]|uniref:carbon-nitrogen hydrolase family protein n=1 Tax=Streptomyces sp. ISL-36 TaxID=2819182 RepID=UPI001BE7A906|nr:carbon-nitrogen hydrolase family protein [Streptomyces sp. ISL-36]MBT2440263.1 carbon-nitrogen hydrolase family protein [Streptomyces sp. ISL-36]
MIVAAAQFTPVPGDLATNVRTVAELIRAAGADGARVVVFPELALSGYEPALIGSDPALHLAEDDDRLAPIRESCRAVRAAAVVNGPVLTPQGRPGITSLVIGPDGTLLTRYDKVNLHGVEHDVFAPGTDEGRFELDGVRFALATCYDNRFPGIAERAAAEGCGAYLASSVLDVANDSFEKVYPVRARDNSLYVVLANVLGANEAGTCEGRSGAWGPDGERIADAGPADPGFVLADVGR